jgi:gliding motility-associated-like protein
MQIKIWLGKLVLWLLILIYANNSILYSQNCCCDVVETIDVPGGDFEVPPSPPINGWIDYTAGQFLGPWEIISGSVSHHDDGHNNLGAGNPNPSSTHLDINGFNVGSVCQNIPGFIIGQEYELVFYYAIHNALSLASATVEIDGGAALNETWDATNVGSNVWLENSFNFIATAETMSLCFYSLTAVNCCGMLIDDIEIIVICSEDEELPEIITLPPDETYQCFADVPAPFDIEVMDNCALELGIEFTEDYSSTDFCNVVITRTWTVEDDCGNITAYSQLITVLDIDPPQVVQPLNNLTVSCDQDVEGIFNNWIDDFGGGVIMDDCSAVFTIADHQINNFSDCSENLVTFTFSDFCGNEIVESAYFDIVDNEPPFIDIFPLNLELSCGDNAQILIDDWLLQNAYAEVIDNCSFILENDFNGSYDMSQTVIFTATDLCENQILYTADIIIDADVEIIEIDTFTCDPSQAGIIEILIDNEFCDSLFILDFVLLTSDTITVEMNTCNILEEGVDTLFLSNSLMCDSLVIINTTFKDGDTLYNELTSCIISQVGLDTMFLSNANNCDSLVITNTVFALGDTSFNELTTCNISQVGLDTMFLSNANNCDSLVIINTIFALGDTSYNEFTTCDISQVGSDTLFLTNINNCDSLVVLNTIFTYGDTIYNNIPTCDPIEVAVDTMYLLNSNECDSIVFTSTYLTLNDTIFITDYSCDIQQATYSTIIIPGPICDTIVSMELLPLVNDTVNLEISTCKLSEVGEFTAYHTNMLGCDSVVISNFYYIPNDTVFINSETCFLDEVVQDTVIIFSEECDSILIYSTVLLEENLTIFETFTCNSLDALIDTIYYQNIAGCDSLVITEYIHHPIDFELFQNIDPCIDGAKGSIDILNINGSSQPYLFSFDGINFSGQTGYTQLDPGNYTIYAQDINGCVSSPIGVTIDSYIEIEADLPTDINTNLGAPYQIFIEFSSKPDTFYWSHENLVSCTNCLDPFILADQDIELTLFYIDEYGCLYSEVISIKVNKENGDFFIPNIFSPNGDNINDFFLVFSNDPLAKLVIAEVYDRWGNIIYQNQGSEILQMKWDGTFEGEDVETGVFIYRIVVINGKGERVQFSGDITLLR